MLDPTVLHVIERWEDEAAFEAHLATAHAKRMNEFLGKIGVIELLIKSYAASDGNVLMGA